MLIEKTCLWKVVKPLRSEWLKEKAKSDSAEIQKQSILSQESESQ